MFVRFTMAADNRDIALDPESIVSVEETTDNTSAIYYDTMDETRCVIVDGNIDDVLDDINAELC